MITIRRKARGKGILTNQVMDGSDGVGLRQGSIVVVRVSKNRAGEFTQTQTSYPKTAQNIRTAKRYYGGLPTILL